MEQFDRDIFPSIEELLKNANLGNEDLYLRLYMIGKSRSRSRPVIMVCCSSPEVRAQAEGSIQASSVLDIHPGFALGACAIPLEQPGPVRGLTSRAGQAPVTGNEDRKTASPKSFGQTPIRPMGSVGGRLFVKHSLCCQPATGGVALYLPNLSDSGYYQVTTSHVFHPEPISEAYQHNLEECHFEGISEDDEGDESENDTEANPITSNCETGIPSDANLDLDNSDYILSARYENPVLDYALLSVELAFLTLIPPNEVTITQGSSNRSIRIQEVASIPSKDHKIVVVTASSGAIQGVLIPSAVYFRNGALGQIQKFYPIQLESPLFEGDSGSVVIDPTFGHLFGHLVRGVSGSTVQRCRQIKYSTKQTRYNQSNILHFRIQTVNSHTS